MKYQKKAKGPEDKVVPPLKNVSHNSSQWSVKVLDKWECVCDMLAWRACLECFYSEWLQSIVDAIYTYGVVDTRVDLPVAWYLVCVDTICTCGVVDTTDDLPVAWHLVVGLPVARAICARGVGDTSRHNCAALGRHNMHLRCCRHSWYL